MNLFSSGRLVDLSHSFSEETIYWPTEEGFKFEREFDGLTEKGYYYAANKFCSPEHGGTHIDAPIHFLKDGQTVDQIPIEQLFSQTIVVNVSEKSKENSDYEVSIKDFTNWESIHGKIPDDSIVLLYTGFGKYWPDKLKYIGTSKSGQQALSELHFPGLHPDAAKWLVENRKINAVGLDTASIDFGQSKLFHSHRILCKNNIPPIENVANLDQLPETGAYVVALPMKIAGGSGAPLRMVAIIPEKD